jgi:uncharacterized protein YecE (DUF72 family)
VRPILPPIAHVGGRGEPSPVTTTVVTIRYGTSSWSAKGWLGSFYPKGTRPADFLTHYAKQFDTVECDATYYRPPSRSMVRGWAEKTPDGFTLAAKFPRSIVHGCDAEKPDPARVLVREHVQRETDAFLDVMGELGEKAGPLVLQFPYFNLKTFASLGAFLDRLEPFLAGLDPRCRYVVEVRNKAWLTPELLHVLRRHRVALALVDLVYMPHPADLDLDLATTDFGYVRLIGDRKATEEASGGTFDRIVIDHSERLERWAQMLDMLQRRSGLIYVYANNHFAGHGPTTIKDLAGRIAQL